MTYETAQDLFDALAAPFPAEYVEWRIGATNQKWRKEGEPLKGTPLCYIDARCVMDRLDTICGPDGWQNDYSAGINTSIICNLKIRMPSGEWLSKADGAGATDMEGEKGMLSDALKRAAVRWGIGRYLYEIKAPRIELEQRGQTAIIPEASHKQLNEIYEKAAQKYGWGSPTDVATYKVLLAIVRDTVTQPGDVQPFLDKHKSMIPMLRVSQRRHLEQVLGHIGGEQSEAA
jgi:hypothetical protein